MFCLVYSIHPGDGETLLHRPLLVEKVAATMIIGILKLSKASKLSLSFGHGLSR
jgi:hypothetical protein